jgi:hypothetical protein
VRCVLASLLELSPNFFAESSTKLAHRTPLIDGSDCFAILLQPKLMASKNKILTRGYSYVRRENW